MNTTSSTRSTMRSMESESLNIVKGTSVIKSYLNGKSVLFTAMCGFSISRAAVILCNLIATLFMVAIVAVETAPIVTMIAVTLAAYFVRMLNERKEAHDAE